MASAIINSLTASTSGDWPSGAGTGGYWIKAATTDGSAVASLPAYVTGCAWLPVTPGFPGYRNDTSGSPRLMALPGGGRNASSWADFGPLLPNITTTVPTRIWVHGYAIGGSPSYGWEILDAGTNAVLASASVTANTTTDCIWLDATVSGAIKLRPTNGYTRIQGVLFSPVGGATYNESAWAGVAIASDAPPSLAIAQSAWAGIEIGGDWPAAQGSDPRTLREAIYARLKASATLAAVVGANVHHARIPQGAALPAVVFTAPSRSYGHNLAGGDGTSSATVQVDCWGTAPDQCEAAATAVRLAFQGFRGDVGLVKFLGCFVDDVGDTVERDSPGSDAWTYRTIITLEARHRVSIPAQEA